MLAALGATAVAGGVGLYAGSEGAAATVATDGLSIPDDSYAAADGDLYSPVVQVDASWSFEGADAADSVMVALLVDGTLLTTTTADATAPSDSGTTALEGVVVDSRAWSSDDWQPPDGGQVTRDVTTEVRLEVRDVDGNTLASASASDSAAITVSDGGPTTAASLGGTGGVVYLEEQGGRPQE